MPQNPKTISLSSSSSMCYQHFFPAVAKATIAFSHARRNHGGWRCHQQQRPTQPTTTTRWGGASIHLAWFYHSQHCLEIPSRSTWNNNLVMKFFFYI
jgi:hypothetical protein